MATQKTTQLTGRASVRAGSYIDGELQKTPSQRAAEGPQAERTTVKMDVLRDGSFAGGYRHTGETIDVPDDHVEVLELSGFAARADRVERAQRARDEQAKDRADEEAAAAKRNPSRTAVQPLGTSATSQQGGDPAKAAAPDPQK